MDTHVQQQVTIPGFYFTRYTHSVVVSQTRVLSFGAKHRIFNEAGYQRLKIIRFDDF
jgi:hypothetical protein